MAQRVITQFVSDLSGEELGTGGQTVTVGWEGSFYEVDLSTAEAEKLERALAPYLKVGRKVSSGGSSLAESAAPASRIVSRQRKFVSGPRPTDTRSVTGVGLLAR